MADEEVDWGMDESVDVDEWRGAAGGAGPGGARGGVGEGDGDDDVLSLGGGDEGLEEATPVPIRSTSPAKPSSKQPPTGPRRALRRPATNGKGVDAETDSGKGATGGALPSSNSAEHVKSTSETRTQTTTDSQRAHTPPPPEEPLPAGWTRLVSRSHGKTFYFHKDTNTTSWSRPTGQPDRPKSPPAPPPEDKPDVAVPANREAGVSQTAKSQPVSPEKSAMQNSGGVNAEQSTKQESPKQQDNSNGTASAGKADRERAPPSGPSGWKGFHEERGRARSPDPRGSGGREDDPKRFRGDDRDREAYRRARSPPRTSSSDPRGPSRDSRSFPPPSAPSYPRRDRDRDDVSRAAVPVPSFDRPPSANPNYRGSKFDPHFQEKRHGSNYDSDTAPRSRETVPDRQPSMSGSAQNGSANSIPVAPRRTEPTARDERPGLSSQRSGLYRDERTRSVPVDEPPRRPRSPLPDLRVPRPADRIVQGANTAPLTINRWGTSSGTATPVPGRMDDRNRAPDTRRPPFETQHIAGSSYRPAATPSPEKKDVAELGKPPLADRLTRPAATSASVPPPTQVSNKVLDERAKLREEAKKAEEALKRIKEEEERLDKLEAEKKAEAERKQKRDEEDRRRQIDERARDRERELWRSREDARRRDGLPSRPSRDDRGAFQDGRRSPVHALPPIDTANRYRPASSPPRDSRSREPERARPSLADRLDRPPLPYMRGGDAYRPSEDSSNSLPLPPRSRRTSPAPRDLARPRDRDMDMARERERERERESQRPRDLPPRSVDIAARGMREVSPPRRNGDSYYPDVEARRDGGRGGDRPRDGIVLPRDLAERISRPRNAPEPVSLHALRMGRSPPRDAGYRSLAERMSSSDDRRR